MAALAEAGLKAGAGASGWAPTRPRIVASLLLVLASLGACSPDVDRFKRLAERHEKTTGYVRLIECGSRGRTANAYYRFEVNGVPQAGRDDSGQIACRTSKVGDAVVVYYDPDDPRTHTLMSPQAKYDRVSGTPPMGAVFLAGLVLLLVVSLWREARKPIGIPQRRWPDRQKPDDH